MTVSSLLVWLCGGLVALSGFLSFVPNAVTVLTVVFSALFAVSMILWSIHLIVAHRLVVIGVAGGALLLFFLALLLSLPTVLEHGRDFGGWLRGVIPFIFLVIYGVLRSSMTSRDLPRIVNFIHLASVFWAIKIVAVVSPEWRAIVAGDVGRLSYITMDVTIPFNLIGLTLSLFNTERPFVRWRWPLVGLFSVLMVATGYRSQMLMAPLLFLLFFFRQRPGKKLACATIAGVMLIVAFAFIGSLEPLRYTTMGRTLESRFTRLPQETESRRVLEMRYALSQFAESPILGKGLGNPVPVEETFPAYQRIHIEASTVPYIHNVVGYLLMDLGLVGCLPYLAFLGIGLLRGYRDVFRKKVAPPAKLTALICLASLILYMTISATFRHIQTNLVLASLLAVLNFRPQAAARLHQQPARPGAVVS